MYPAYAAIGGNRPKRDRAVAKLKSHVDPAFESFNLAEFPEGPSLEAADLMASLEQLPFGAEQRIVIVHEADKLPKETSDAIVGYLKDPNLACVLLLEAEKLAKNTRLYKAVASSGPQAIIACESLKAYEIPGYIRQEGSRLGLTVLPDAADEMACRLGETLELIDTTLESIAQVHGPRTLVDKALVKAEVPRVVEPKPWDFCDAICRRNLKEALEIYGRFDDNTEVLLHKMLVDRLRELLVMKSLVAQGKPGDFKRHFANKAWMANKLAGWSRNFSAAELRQALAAAIPCEQAIKGSKDAKTAMIAWCASICAKKPS